MTKEDFRKELTNLCNKYFNANFKEIEADEMIEVFEIGYKIKYKNEIQNYKDSIIEFDDYMKKLEENSIANNIQSIT